MKKFFPLASMLGTNLFFALSSIVGYQYGGIEEGSSYWIFCGLIFLINIFLCIKDILRFKGKLTRTNFIFLVIIPMIYISLGLKSILFNNIDINIIIKYMIFFIIWPIGSIYSAVYLCRNNYIKYITKNLELIMFIFTVALIKSIIFPILLGKGSYGVGGSTYQTASYMAIFSYGINLYLIFFGDNHIRFKFTRSKFYKVISLLLLIFQLISFFIAGGRGALILFVVYTLYIICSVLHSRKPEKIKMLISYSFVLSILIIIIIPFLVKNEMFISGINRIFEFISPNGGINWKGTSGRDDIYIYTINMIMSKPIFGYGLFGYAPYMTYPHNIFLEVLIEGGVIYFVLCMMIIVYMILKLKALVKNDEKYRILIIIFLYPMVMLMFSGSYMRLSEIWFIITIIFNLSIFKNTNYIYTTK